MMEGPQHGITGDFGSTVEVLVIEGMVFGHRLLHRVAIYGSGGGIDKALHTHLDASFHYFEGAAYIDIKSAARVVVALQQPECCQMKDAIGSFEGRFENVCLHDVATHVEDFHSGILERVGQILDPTAHEIVVDQNFFDIFCQQVVGGVGADEAGTTDQNKFLTSQIHEQPLCRSNSPMQNFGYYKKHQFKITASGRCGDHDQSASSKAFVTSF